MTQQATDKNTEVHGPGVCPGAFCDDGCDAYCALRHLSHGLDFLGITAEVQALNDTDLAVYLTAKDAAGLGQALDEHRQCCMYAPDDDPSRSA